MTYTTISSRFQIVIPKEIREKLGLKPKQRLQVFEKGGIIKLIPETPCDQLKGSLKGMNASGIRDKHDRG